MTENEKYQIIKKLVNTIGNKQNAALKLGCTVGSINRLIVGYTKSGKEFFVQGNYAHQPISFPPRLIEKMLPNIKTSTNHLVLMFKSFRTFSKIIDTENFLNVKPCKSRLPDYQITHCPIAH